MRGILQTATGTTREAFGPTEWGLLAAAAGIWGSSFLFIAIGLDHFAPGLITLGRLAFGLLALAMFPAARRPIERGDWPRIVVLGVVWMAIPLNMFPIAQQWVDSALTGMLNGAMPLFSALWAALLLRAAPGRIQVAGLAVGFVGVGLITVPSVEGTSSALGVALILGATVCYGLAVNLAVPLQHHYGALPVLWRAQMVSVALTLPFGLAGLPASRFDWSSAIAVVALGVLGTGLAFVAMATLVGRAGATRGAVAIYFVPVVATVLGIGVRGEDVPLAALAGMLAVVAGAYITARAEAAPRPRTGPVRRRAARPRER